MFTQALKFLASYRFSRSRSLRNMERMSWSTVHVKSLKELMDDYFGSDTENSDWEKLAAGHDADHLKMQAVRLKIAFLAGCRHDLRNQFAIGEEHEPKTVLDYDRHAIGEILATQYRMDAFEQAIKTKEAGATSL